MDTALYVDREEAAKILKVSTRTVDRYLRRYRFKTKKNGRVVLIRRENVDQIIKEHIGQFLDADPAMIDRMLDNSNVNDDMSKLSNIVVKDFKVSQKKNGQADQVAANNVQDVYKNLFAETKKELKEKQERLDAATYRVGQLESQLKNMVPVLDYTRKEKELKELNSALEQKDIETTQILELAEKKLRTERMAKYIYLSLVGLLLVAEPILFLFWAFS